MMITLPGTYTLERAEKFERSADRIEANPILYADILDRIGEFRDLAAHIREHIAKNLTIFHHLV